MWKKKVWNEFECHWMPHSFGLVPHRQNRKLLLRSWMSRTTLDCEIPSSPDNSSNVTHLFDSDFIYLGFPDLSWSWRFWQTERNFLNPLVTVLWSTAPSIRKVFRWFYDLMIQLELVKRMRLRSTFICAALKTHQEWCKGQYAPPNLVLFAVSTHRSRDVRIEN